ncbi:hypothetical protein [Chryseobacterium sp.]|uniref:hypothetical protein n=1 Tax=Chryseobacterium sp. TaxID=1871047 RepID=UPI0025C2662B|nr:hypothetical protein [Chryseobacterium sp.]
MKPKEIPGVPEQKEGGFHDTESKKCFDTPEITYEKFKLLKKRLFSINQWKEYSGEGTTDFQLYDPSGHHVDRIPKTGDFVRIDIPGPGNVETKGYDWVKIIKISNNELGKDDIENFLMICNPSPEPGNHESDHIAHFYSAEATSTFMISRNNTCIKASVHGRNESPNFKTDLIDKVRNLFTAAGGMVGLAKIQWKLLSDGLLDID